MFGAFSLSRRLTLFFTLVTSVVIIGFWVLVMSATRSHFEMLDTLTLHEKKLQINALVLNAPSLAHAKEQLAEFLKTNYGLFLRLEATDGAVFALPREFRVPAAIAQAPASDKLLSWDDGTTRFNATEWALNLPSQHAETLTILAAIDISHHTQFMRELRNTLLLYSLLAIVIGSGLARLAAYQGLAPLQVMQTKAAALSSQRFSERMPEEAVPIEMAELARALNRMLDRLESDFQRLSDFSSDLAHELRTPISNLLTQTQVVLIRERDAVSYRDILASNAEEFQRLARTVSDMLFLAKTERSLELPSTEPFFAAAEARAILEFYEPLAELKKITLALEGEASIVGDRLMCRRALSNLLSNALRHSAAGQTVRVTISRTAQEICLCVENSGADIAPQALPRLFDRFYRADASRARPDAESSGLGLAITRAIVEAHGGRVSVSSSGGKTQFFLFFPCS